MTKYEIDAKNQKLGRIASNAAEFLMGKKLPTFKRNAVAEVTVEIKNASKMSITEKKLMEKTYKEYSGHPGGLKILTMKQLAAKKGNAELIREAVNGMLPHNKLQRKVMKNLIITE